MFSTFLSTHTLLVDGIPLLEFARQVLAQGRAHWEAPFPLRSCPVHEPPLKRIFSVADEFVSVGVHGDLD